MTSISQALSEHCPWGPSAHGRPAFPAWQKRLEDDAQEFRVDSPEFEARERGSGCPSATSAAVGG